MPHLNRKLAVLQHSLSKIKGRFFEARSSQLRIFCFGLLQDGNIGVGVFPEREEILIGRLCLSGVALHGIGAGKAKMRQHEERVVLPQR
jgi:hypothetical protein